MTDVSTAVVVLKLHAQGALGAVRTLGRLGIPVFGVHENRRGPVARSRFLREVLQLNIDDAQREVAVEQLCAFARRIGGRPLLMATDDVGALFVADKAEDLRDAFRFPELPPGMTRALYSKAEMYAICMRLGTPTPRTEFPRSQADVQRWIERGGSFPVVVKPIDGWRLQRRGGQMAIVDDASELLEAYDRLEDADEPNLMLQEYVPGAPETVWMFNGYFDERSECLVSFTGRKLRQRPAYTGMTSLGICARNDDVANATLKFAKAVGYRGVIDIGWRYDARDGVYKLLDVNPRVGNTFRLFVATNGLDAVRALYLDLTGQPVAGGDQREGRKWVVENFDIASSVTYFRDGHLTLGQWLRSFRGVEEAAWWARDDVRPFLGMGIEAIGKVTRKVVGVRHPARRQA